MVLDPLTAFIVATIYSLLSGAVLGFMHGALPRELQSSAADWRIGTLVIAGGGALFVGQLLAGATWVIPIANGCWVFGLAMYWRAVRRYFGAPDTYWIFVPAVVGVAVFAFCTFFYPSLSWRLGAATLSWVILLTGSATTLIRHRNQDNSVSSKVLTWIFIALAFLLLARGVHYLTQPTVVMAIGTPINFVNILTPLLAAVLPILGTTVFVLLCFERIRRVLHRIATTDALTGLPNRRTIAERAEALFERAKSLRLGFSIAVIDIDHFKRVNDLYGHDGGDIVLKAVAATLTAECRGTRVVGRQGGEEFVALFEDANVTDVLAAAERLRMAIEASSHRFGEAALSVTISVGVATFVETDREFADVLRRADRALYAAKAAGRNCVRAESMDILDAPDAPNHGR